MDFGRQYAGVARARFLAAVSVVVLATSAVAAADAPVRPAEKIIPDTLLDECLERGESYAECGLSARRLLQGWIDNHPGPYLHTGDLWARPWGTRGSNGIDETSHIRPTDMGHDDLEGEAPPNPEIQMIHGGSPYRDPDLTRARLRNRHFVNPDNLRTSELRKNSSFHGSSPERSA